MLFFLKVVMKRAKNFFMDYMLLNYSALISCGITASALSGMRFGLPRLASAVADELFRDHGEQILKSYFEYNVSEFVGEWPTKDDTEQNSTVSTIE